MKLYNTLTKQVEELQPQKSEEVAIYSCGPTVYDHIHIGNLSAFIYADTLRRALKVSGLHVHHVMNLTDVDDKTIRRSQEKYSDLPAKQALQKLTSEYGEIFFNDMRAVGNDIDAYEFTKATDFISQMQDLIRQLLKDHFAYLADDGVYFSIAKYKASGKKYGQLTEITESSTSEARIENDEYDKDNAHDFALWKRQKSSEPAWDFDIDGQDLKGRPGWHIECSAMSVAKLSQPFDIHTGGVDLIFPHHENEIAQSTAGKPEHIYAKTFIHNEHILVDGKKMSKSLGNFYTLQDIIDKGFDPLAFRILVLQSHYRNQAHFSWENLEAAQNRLKDLRALAVLQWQPQEHTYDGMTISFEDVAEEIATCLQQDLATPQALALLNTASTQIQTVLVDVEMVPRLQNMLRGLDKAFGLKLADEPDISAEQKQLIQARENARSEKDWVKSDELRDKLAEQGVGLRDTEHGSIWFRL